MFYLLVPLARAMRVRTGKNYLLYVMSICAGATVSHSLVPPTPGPIAMAATLNLDLGIVILVGIMVGHSHFAQRMGVRALHGPQDARGAAGGAWAALGGVGGTRAQTGKRAAGLLVFHHADSASCSFHYFEYRGQLGSQGERRGSVYGVHREPRILRCWFQPPLRSICLRGKKHYSLTQLAKPVETALASGGLIILITAAGGAFRRDAGDGGCG